MRDFSSALVTGSTGFIGSGLVRRLSEAGKRVYCLTRNESTNLERIVGLTGVEVLTIPSYSPQNLNVALKGVRTDVVFHLAAYGVSPNDRDPHLMVEGNIGSITGLLMAVDSWPLKKFIHTGSCSEYGKQPNREPISEDALLQPLSLYGAAKAASISYGKILARQLNIPFAVLRLFGVYGPGESQNRLLPHLIESLVQDKPAELSPGGQIRDYLHVDDVIDCFMEAASSDSTEGIYNVCSGIPVSIQELSFNLAEVMAKPTDLLHLGKLPYRSDEPMWLVGSNERFKKVTGWAPRIRLEEGLATMANLATGKHDMKKDKRR